MEDPTRWPVPASFLELDHEPARAGWLADLSRLAAEQAARWQVRPHGSPMHGWTSVLWPVLDPADHHLIMKLGAPEPSVRAEGAALVAWRARAEQYPASRRTAMIQPVQHDPDNGALLLPRLDPVRTLEDWPDLDQAVEIIAEVLAGIGGTPAPEGIPRMLDQVIEMRDGIVATGTAAGHLDRTRVERALDTLAQLAGELSRPDAEPVLLHNDCHFLNVLHTLPGEPAAWVGIDPWPAAGLREWEVTPLLRNWWAEAAATGNPDAALRRRVDQVAEIAGMNAEVVRACAQAVAIQNLGWLLLHRRDHMFVPPYSVMSWW